MLRIGIIGVVSELPKLCSSIAEMKEIQFIGFHCINDENFANNFARFSSLNELLLATDAVYISSKSANHEDVIERSIKNQIHTLVEFPFIIDTDRGNELMNLAHEANIKLQVGNPLKFTPVYLGIKDKFDSPMFIESHQLQSINSELTNTSVIQNLMIKDIDVILSIVQSSVKKISANGVAVVNGTPDITNARIEFENGCVANLTASRVSLKKMRKTRVFQKDAYVSIDFLEKKTEIVSLREVSSWNPFAMNIEVDAVGNKKTVQLHKPKIKQLNAIQEELVTFAQAIQNNNTPLVTLNDGCKALRVAHIIMEKINDRISKTLPNA